MTAERRPRRFLRPILALGGGVMLACAFQPVDLPALSVVAVGIFCALTWTSTWREGALLGAVFGLGFFGPLLWWLWASIAPLAWLALSATQAGWFAVLGMTVAATRSMRFATWRTALLWTAVEVLRSAWPLGGLPWGRLGFSALDTVWEGWLGWSGVAATGFVMALLGATLARTAMVRARVAAIAGVLGLGLLSLAPAAVDAVTEPTYRHHVRVGIVQGGVPGAGNRLVDHHREVTDNHARETVALARRLRSSNMSVPDFVLWPENSTAVDPMTDSRARHAIRKAALAVGRPVLVGSIADGPGPSRARNQGVVWSPDGAPRASYTKRHLVPFGEYVPWRALATRLSARVADIPRDMVPGEAAAPLDVGGVDVANALCFDVAFDDVLVDQVRRGADLIAIQTSNAMFLGTAQLEQQWDISRVRAIESGRSVIVASVNGVSGAIDPAGDVIARLSPRYTASEVVQVPLSQELTPAVRWGGWPGRAALALAALILVRAVGASWHRRSTISRSSHGPTDGNA